MPVVSFASSKGGCGKTTAAIVLSTVYAGRGNRVTVIDCDPAQWAASWGQNAEQNGTKPDTLTVLSLPSSEDALVDQIESAGTRGGLVVLDVEGSKNSMVSAAISMSDLVVTPLQASGMDAKAALDTIQLVQAQSRIVRRQIGVMLLFTRTNPLMQTRLQASLTEQLKNAFPVSEVSLVDRVAFREMLNRNCTLDALGDDVSGVDKARENARRYAADVIVHLRRVLEPAQVQAEQVGP